MGLRKAELNSDGFVARLGWQTDHKSASVLAISKSDSLCKAKP